LSADVDKAASMTTNFADARRLLPKEPQPLLEQFYDPIRQVWADRLSGALAVEQMRYRPAASAFGETTLTEAREGADHAASPLLAASNLGKTPITQQDEGADERVPADLLASRFGETTMTKASGEGADQTAIVSDEPYTSRSAP
jgi:hypothetical protein